MHKRTARILQILTVFSAGALVITLNLKEDLSESFRSRRSFSVPPPSSIRHFTFGHRETVGDSLWMRAIQQFDKCEQDRGASPLTSEGLRMGLDRTPECNRGWVFQMLNLILDLVPRFYYPARVGPVILSVVIDDIEGATIIYEKALRNFPNDWIIASRAAYHFTFELEDNTRGSLLYYRAAKLGGPSWMALYASKLSNKEGKKELAIRMIKDFMESKEFKPSDIDIFSEKLKELQK